MARKGPGARMARALLLLALGFVLVSALAVLTLRWVDPWTSALMLESRVEAWRAGNLAAAGVAAGELELSDEQAALIEEFRDFLARQQADASEYDHLPAA